MAPEAEYTESLDASRGLLYGLAAAAVAWLAIALAVVALAGGLT
ncbi:hypothetical protein VD659_06830 [Herbiconiux sp. 11R-BC]